jgi:hypothetical protein
MLAPMRALWVALALAVAVSGCGPDCGPSADIEVTVVPSPAVDAATIARLRLVLSVNGAPAKTLDFTPPHVLDGPSSVILRPDPVPGPKYTISVTVEALDAAGDIVEIGGTSGEVSANGCNRLRAVLAALSVPDGNFTPDGGGADLTCFGSDEDSDGRPNSCDLCPADYDPVPSDGDGDGVPDACDPDPQRPGNRVLYFEPFDVADGHWSGTFQVTNSYLAMSVPNMAQSMNGLDTLTANVRAQTILFSPGYFTAAPVSSMGIFVGDSANFGSASGMLCTINFYNGPQNGTLEMNVVQNGSIQPPTQQQFPFGNNVVYRLRLTQRGNNWSCEGVANGIPPTTVTGASAAAPTGPLFMGLFAANIEVHFHSVVAESALP